MSRSEIQHLRSRIHEEALRLGFSGIGFAAAGRLPGEEKFLSWLEKGFHGEMRYMERQAQKRLDPRRIFPEARSMILLAMNYYTGEKPSDASMRGRISRYAWGDDYHSIVSRRLERLLDFIRILEPSAQGLCYTDTGPVMEKVWGARTSLGWIGKNTSLIIRSLGSWFFIGVILLDLELEQDISAEDFCGTCRRCLDACPTGAIVAPYVLDARRCISYLTIELRGPIPRPLRPLMGNRIFGCDDCQDACPWNRFAARTSDREFYAREEICMPDLAFLTRISPGEFKKRFKDSPILRATRDGFVRNAVVALGNSRRSDSIPALEEALQDNSPLVRAHAAWALERLGDKGASAILASALSKETHPAVIEEISLALAAI